MIDNSISENVTVSKRTNYNEKSMMNSTLDMEEILSDGRRAGDQESQPAYAYNEKVMSGMSQGKQKMSAQKISLSSPFQRLILFLTLASATLSQFAFVILIPFLCRDYHESLKSHEIGMLVVALTAGELLAYRYTEPCISNFGIRWSLQLGFLFQITTGYAFWYVSFI